MKPAYCEKHGVEQFVLTSPRLADAIKLNEYFCSDEILKLKIESSEGCSDFFIDIELLKKFKLSEVDRVVTLHDRDKPKNILNDRLLIQKIIRYMKWVCPLCLIEIVDKRPNSAN